MHLFYRTILWIDWFMALAWLLRVVTWNQSVKRVPDLTKLGADTPEHSLPRLSVIVPARNEEESITATIESLLRCRGVPLEIIAVDDRSEDETGAIMDLIMDRIAEGSAGQANDAGGATLRVLHIDALPPGWLGKTHAMAVASRHATGEWLLFTDGDVLFREDALRRALALAIDSAADHFVLMPTLILKSWGERMMLSFLNVMTVWVFRPWRVPDMRDAKRDAIGVGAFNMIRRNVYDAIGGWEALRMEVVEDLALGARVKRLGFAQRVAFGRGIINLRWAHGVQGVIGNLAKNLFAFFRFRPALVLGFLPIFVLFTLFPLAAVVAGTSACAATSIMLFAVWLDYRQQAEYHPFTAWQIVLFPIASVTMLYTICRSTWIVLLKGGISWRGTFYSLSEIRQQAEASH